MLLILFLLPFLSALLLFFVAHRITAFVLSLLPLILLLVTGPELIGERVDVVWLPVLSIHFHIAVDTISFIFLYLISVIIPISILSSNQPFYALILLLQGLLVGFFTSQDLVSFTFFFEAILVPLYFIINIWGGEDKERASFNFILYMIAGSTLMIAAVLALYFATGSFDMKALSEQAEHVAYAPLLAAIFLLAFSVKTPLFPFHSWLPGAYAEAPVAGSILLSALLSKAGIYGIWRISYGFFPHIMEGWSPLLLTLAIIGVLYGAFAAWGQNDFKRLIAYSSFSHVNFILAGMFVWNQMAQMGALLQVVNHAITVTGLFLVAGWLAMRLHTTRFGTLSGLATTLPCLCWLSLFFVLSAVALPGLNNFVSEVLLLYGVSQKSLLLSALLGLTVIFSVVYLLRWMHSVFFETAQIHAFQDIRVKEFCIAAPLILLVIWLGVYPSPVLTYVEEASKTIILKNHHE